MQTFQDEFRILVIGDSIVEGDGSTNGKGWVGLLREKYWGKGIWITNLGVSGDTSYDIVRRSGIVYGYRPDRIVLAIGINDSCTATKVDNQPINSVENLRSNLDELIHHWGQRGADIRIIGLTTVDESHVQPFPGSTTGKSYYNSIIEQYDKELEQIARDYDCKFLSPIHLLQAEDLIDGLHPNDEGYQKMADFLEEFVVGE